MAGFTLTIRCFECDDPSCGELWEGSPGENWAQVTTFARAESWTFIEGKAFCPQHSKVASRSGE